MFVRSTVEFSSQIDESGRNPDQILMGLLYTSSMNKQGIVYNLTKVYQFAMKIPLKKEEEQGIPMVGRATLYHFSSSK